MKREGLFRAIALERAAGPVEADAPLTLAGRGRSLGFVAAGLVLLMALVWRIPGAVPIRIGIDGTVEVLRDGRLRFSGCTDALSAPLEPGMVAAIAPVDVPPTRGVSRAATLASVGARGAGFCVSALSADKGVGPASDRWGTRLWATPAVLWVTVERQSVLDLFLRGPTVSPRVVR